MDDTAENAPKVPRGWLWLARGVTLFFALLSVAIALAMFVVFLRNVVGRWYGSANLAGFALCLVAFVCGIDPYARVLWRLRSEKARGKGLSEALILGAFWFFAEAIVLSDSGFEALSGFGAPGVPWDSAGRLEMFLGIGLVLSLPGFLLLLSGMKLAMARSDSLPASGTANDHLGAVRAGVGAALILILFPAAIYPFTLRHGFSGPELAVLEALLLTQAIPYALVWRNLKKGKLQAQKIACDLATGFLTLLILGGTVYGLIAVGTPTSHPHYKSTWAELVFFALLGIANLAILLAGRRARRALAAGEEKKPFAPGALVVPLCLFLFGLLFVVFASGT